MNWKRIICIFCGHKEEIYRKREDHRVLLWVCSRCNTVTRSLKMNYLQMKLIRKGIKNVH